MKARPLWSWSPIYTADATRLDSWVASAVWIWLETRRLRTASMLTPGVSGWWTTEMKCLETLPWNGKRRCRVTSDSKSFHMLAPEAENVRLPTVLRQKHGPVGRLKAYIALISTPMPELRDVTYHKGSRNVTCYPTQANALSPNPSPQTGNAGYSIYLPRRDGRLSWPRLRDRESNWRPLDHKPDALTTTPPSHWL